MLKSVPIESPESGPEATYEYEGSCCYHCEADWDSGNYT